MNRAHLDSRENAEVRAKIDEAKRRLRMPALSLCGHEMSNVAVRCFRGCEPVLENLQAFHPPSVIENLLWLPPVGTLAPSKGGLQENKSSKCTENLPSLPRS